MDGSGKHGMRRAMAALIAAMVVAACGPDEQAKPATPEPEAEATDMAEGATPDDPYLWLEEVRGERAIAWVEEANSETLAIIKGDPRYQADHDAAYAILAAEDRIPYGELRGPHIYNFWQDNTHVRGLWRRAAIGSYAASAPEWDVILDIDALAAAENENWVYSGTSCSPALERCLVRLSRAGGDAHVTREFDLASRSFVADGFVLPEAKSSVEFVSEDSVLVGTDFGEGSLTTSGYPRIVKLWQRGTPVETAATVLEGKTQDVGLFPVAVGGAEAKSFIIRAVSFFETETYYVTEAGDAVLLPLPLSAEFQGMAAGQVLATLREDWTVNGTMIGKGALVAFALDAFLGSGTLPQVSVLYAPGPRAAIEQVAAGRDAVYVAIFENVIGRIEAFRYDGVSGTWSSNRLPLPDNGSTKIITANEYGPEAQFNFEGFLTPSTLYADDGGDAPRAIKSLPARFDAAGFLVEQHEAVSKDGTRIPYFVVRAEGPITARPTLLYGYGGFQISMTPWYWSTSGRLWLSQGGSYAVANIRGGGEFGPAWHEAARLANRQRAYDDFIAVAEDIVARGYAAPEKLGIMGGSNGGLLVGAVTMQRPDLFGAVVCQVPLLDMLRYTKLPPGASWMAEYGDPDVPAERAWIEKYSPYQNVREGVRYPRIFFVTSTEDDRVHPGHARKMAAKMRGMGHEVFYYENTEGGHSAAANLKQRAEMTALSMIYLKRELGLGQ